MSNIEKARRNLKISGYQHPTEVVSVVNKKSYKTFNSEKKEDDYVKPKPRSGYATFSDKPESNKQYKGCPQCGRDVLYECDCPLKDKQCEKGHVWYVNRDGHIKSGDPHEDE